MWVWVNFSKNQDIFAFLCWLIIHAHNLGFSHGISEADTNNLILQR